MTGFYHNKRLCVAAVLALLFMATAADGELPQCTEADWIGEYTDCRVSSDTRDLLYYKNPNTPECSGGVPCPQSVFNLPCDIACGAGNFLPLGSTTCQTCPVGTFSVGSGERVTDFSKFPLAGTDDVFHFSTYATDSYGTKMEDKGLWASADSGLSLRSGAINNSQSSYLVLPVHFVMDGNVTFEYTVEAENGYDGIEFYLDDTKVMPLRSQETKPVVFTIAVTRGYHTLTWRYLKDISSSVGADAAWIHLLEIQGITYSEDSCQPCPAGYFADQEGSAKCTACPRNTYSAETHSTECIACSEFEYSLEGATSCLPRTVCTSSDYTSSYTDCSWSSSLGKFVKDKTYSWLPTTTCNFSAYDLPADEHDLACDICNPGLVRNRENGKCTWCPAGTISDSTTNECKSCAAGSASNPGLYYMTWVDGDVEDPYGVFNTSCTGTCGSPGWLIADGVLMSGVGHSNAVTSTLEMRFTLDKATKMTYWYFAHTQNIYDGRLIVADHDGASKTHWAGEHQGPMEDSLTLEAGSHVVEFTFVRRSTYSLISSDAAYVYNISIPGAVAPLTPASGGRATGSNTCTPCPAGSYTATAGQEQCSLCEPGYSTSVEGSSSCTKCPKDYFNDVAGDLCRACGPNVHTSGEGSVDCDNTCSFRYESEVENVVFDLTPIARGGAMYGPVTDTSEFSYYVSLCQRNSGDNTTSPCKDENGNPLRTYACQPEPRCGYGETCFDFDTGNTPGYRILNESNPREGFVLSYTGGRISASGYRRSTNITFICTPGGGIGAPHAPDNSTIENPKCHYSLVWESEYGCPLCTEADYSFMYGECKNNLRRKMYYWLSNPRHCHDGVSLPEDEDIPTNCTSKIICEPGFYVDGVEQNCTPCAPGTTSVGTGEFLTARTATAEEGSALPSQLSSTCTGEGCQPFIVDHKQYHASTVGAQVVTLRYTTRFLINGSISFSYSMLGSSGTRASSFVFSVDDKVLLTDSDPSLHTKTVTFPVVEGGRTLTWTVNGTTRFVDIDYILAYGNNYAPTSCSACMPGYYQDEAGKGECKRCPAGQVSAPGFTECQECPQGMYTVDGIECVAQHTCTEEDWVALYTPCVDRKRKLVWTKLYPASCSGGYEPQVDEEDKECAPCGSGMWREDGSDECVGCKLGQVYNNGNCVKPDNGTVSYHTMTFFGISSNGESSSDDTLPNGWTTYASCQSLPEGTLQGWRMRPDGVDAGLSRANETVVSVLTYNDSGFLGKGFVMFDYRLTEPSDEMLFYLDGVYVETIPTSLPNGFSRVQIYINRNTGPSTLVLSWVAVLKSANSESGPSALLQNVRIGGLSTGMATTYYCEPGSEANEDQSYCITCNPGTASNVSGSACRECTSGTYASRSGQNKCAACYTGTESEFDIGSKRCITTCLFEGRNKTVYNLTSLKNTVIGPVKSSVLGGSFFFSVCDGYIPKGKCNSKATEDAYMHACHSGSGSDQDDFGSELEYVAAEEGSSEEDLSFLINFRDGSLCPDGNDDERLQTTILFRCSPGAGTGFPQFLSYSSSTCTATFSWASQYACHICRDSDYEKVVSACTKGIQRTELHKVGHCNGDDRILVEETECTEIEVPIGIAAGAAGLILIMIGVIIFVVYKNRKITYKYTKLLQDTAAELEAMADDDDDGHMTRKLAPVSQDDDEEDEDGKKKKKREDGEEDEEDDDEPQDDDEEEDDGQGVGHIQK